MFFFTKINLHLKYVCILKSFAIKPTSKYDITYAQKDSFLTLFFLINFKVGFNIKKAEQFYKLKKYCFIMTSSVI